MTTIAGYTTTIEASDDDATYHEIGLITDLSFGPSRDLLESTAFDSSNTATRSRFAGLTSGTISFSGLFTDETNGMGTLRTQAEAQADTYIRIKFDGTNGYKVLTHVSNLSYDGAVDGAVNFSATCEFSAAPTAV